MCAVESGLGGRGPACVGTLRVGACPRQLPGAVLQSDAQEGSARLGLGEFEP